MSEPIANDQIHAGLSEQADCATGFAGRALLAALTDAADPADGKPASASGDDSSRKRY